jgi:GT2 family glycosyltransferase
MPRVSIIVPGHNAAADWADCLGSVQEQSFQDVEVLWVDSASTDDSLDSIRRSHPGVRIVSLTANAGFRGGCRAGAAEATGDILVFLNQDTVAEPEWLARLVAGFDRPDVGMAAPLITLHDRPDRVNVAGNSFFYWGLYGSRGEGAPVETFARAEELGAVSGCCFAIRRPLWEELGGFSADYDAHDTGWHAGYEDLDLGWRARLAGWRIVLCPDSRVRHKYIRKGWAGARLHALFHGFLLTGLRNYQARSLLLLSPLIVLTCIGLLLRAACDSPTACARLCGSLSWLWRNRRLVRGMRARVQAARHVPDLALLPFMAAAPEAWRRRFPHAVAWVALATGKILYGAGLRVLELLSPSRCTDRRQRDVLAG